MELAALLWALGDLPAAMAGTGELALGPQPWFLLPLGRLQLFWTPGLPVPKARLRLLTGPWFLWLDLPPPRIALGRAPAYALLALARGPEGVDLAWEFTPAPWLSVYGGLGAELFCGLRFHLHPAWATFLIEGGELSWWCGLSLSF
ncbi:hypothetical protein DRJ54_05570 [Candidatus Acetothermia bacterium]|nr:MAG: hypothetical protein DRJ54_05570 [Candidatus Acetothermia bacterium]